GRLRVICGKGIGEIQGAAEKSYVRESHDARVRGRLPHTSQCRRAVDPYILTDAKGKGNIFLMFHIRKMPHFFVGNLGDLPGSYCDKLRSPVLGGLLEDSQMFPLGRIESCPYWRCACEGPRNIFFRGAHYVEMVRSCIGDNPVG